MSVMLDEKVTVMPVDESADLWLVELGGIPVTEPAPRERAEHERTAIESANRVLSELFPIMEPPC